MSADEAKCGPCADGQPCEDHGTLRDRVLAARTLLAQYEAVAVETINASDGEHMPSVVEADAYAHAGRLIDDALAARSVGVSSDAAGGTEDTPPRGAAPLRPCRWCAIPTDPRELDHRGVCIPCDDEWHQARADEQAEMEAQS